VTDRLADLSPERRAEDLRSAAATEADVVVIGGGVVGAGCALDSASRGLRVVLVEQRDLASGTSSRSSKLFHGGLRYLEQREFRLVAEALRERGLMVHRLCPHLAAPVSFVYPLRRRGWERLYVGAGVALYDLFARRGPAALPRHRHLGARSLRRLVPALRADAAIGGVRYWDALVDDARHTVALSRTAAAHGASILTSMQVVRLLRAGDRVVGVVVRDSETGEEVELRARQVVNATATWTDEIQSMAGRGTLRVRASKGIHLVVPRDRIPADSGMILRTPSSVLFVIPWRQHWIVGTTDTDWHLDLAHPAATAADIDYLLGQLNSVLRSPLGHEDIEGVYAGLRPLLEGESEETSALSREHAVHQTVPGLVTVAGGKYTTYRVMARDAVDVVARNLGGSIAPSCTEDVPLVGAEGFTGVWNRRARLAAEAGLPGSVVEHLLRRHGTDTLAILGLVAERAELGRPIGSGGPYLRAEVVHACRAEGARHLDDVLARRTRLSIETFHRGVACAREVAELMSVELGWDAAAIDAEVEAYEERVRAERHSQTQPDDVRADAARGVARERRRPRPLRED